MAQAEISNGVMRKIFIGPVPVDPTPVPEPSAGLLLGMGVMSLAAFRSRKTLFRRA